MAKEITLSGELTINLEGMKSSADNTINQYITGSIHGASTTLVSGSWTVLPLYGNPPAYVYVKNTATGSAIISVAKTGATDCFALLRAGEFIVYPISGSTVAAFLTNATGSAGTASVYAVSTER